ncbi:hypothetical protein [Cupriavidus necator]
MNPNKLSEQLDVNLATYKKLQNKSDYDDLSDLPMEEQQALVTRSIAAVSRIAGENSVYAKDIRRVMTMNTQMHLHIGPVLGIVRALRDDVAAGYTQALVDLVHAEVFSDFLEMAQHLLDAAYKDAAAVIAGSALEAHLRSLCAKVGVAVESIKADGAAVPKKADALNAELASKEAYNKADQKSVTAWLDIRNKAAHGKYPEYSDGQVALLIAGIRDFVARTS